MTQKAKKILITVGIVAAVLLMLYSCFAGTYNGIVAREEGVNSSWAQVQNQYQRRYDLIPNLVETVKGYASHEEGVLTEVTEARAKMGGVVNIDSSVLDDPEEFKKFQKVQDDLGRSLQRLMAVTENYPQLKANQNFLALQDQLEGTENRIATERKRFNDAVQGYNLYIRMFPKSIIANMNGFKAKSYFTAGEDAQTAPQVKF